MAATWVPIGFRSVKSVQLTTEAAPTLESDGFPLDDVAAFTISLEADSGQTLAGAGFVDVYHWDYAFAAWAFVPNLSGIYVPSTAAGQRRAVLITIPIDNPVGRMAMIANGITVSSGGVTLYARCSRSALTGGQRAI